MNIHQFYNPVKMIKKIIAGALSLLLLGNTAFAIGLNSDIGIQTYTTLEGSVNVVPIDTTYQSGSNTTRWAKIWTTDLDVSGVFTFGGMMGSNLDMDGYNLILDTDGDTLLANDRDAVLGDDEFAFDINGARDFKWAANLFTILAGSNVILEDATAIKSGSDSDWILSSYDEANDDVLLDTTAKVASQNIDYGMYQVVTDTGNASMTANQEIFEIGKGAARAGQPNWVELLALDEDGDLGIAGVFAPAGGITLNDDVPLNQGTGLDYGQLYETADANALEMVYYIDKTKDANNVPVFVYGDETALNKDLGLFNGVTAPTIAIVDDAAAKSLYFQHDGTDGQIKSTAGGIKIVPLAGQTLTLASTTSTTTVLGSLLFSINGMYSSATSSYIGLGGVTAADSFFTYDKTTAQFGAFLGSNTGRQFIIGEATYNVNAGAYDYDHATESNPVMYLQSVNSPSVDNRQWVKWYNDGSNSYHLTGIGGHRFGFEAIQANAILTFTANPSTNNGIVFTVNTGTLTGKTAGAGANEFNFGANLTATLNNLVTAWNLIAGTGVVAHRNGNTVVFEASATGSDANAYVTVVTTDNDNVLTKTNGVSTFQSTLRFTAVPTTNLGVVFTVGTGTLTGTTGAPGANQFQIASTLSETMDNIVRAYNLLATGVTAIRIDDDVYFDGGTTGVPIFTETTDTDNVYSFVATTMTGGRAFSAFMDMQPTYMKLTKQGTATAGTTSYASQYFGLIASGWNTGTSLAQDVEFRLQTTANTGATINGTFNITHWRAGSQTGVPMTLSSTGTLTILNGLTMAGDLTDYEATNDANPSIFLGSAAAERLEIQSVYDGGAQTLNYVQFQTYAASATADKGKYIFGVDGTTILSIVDAGITVVGDVSSTTHQGITLASGANTFSATRGTASLDIAAASTLDVNANLTVESASFINQDLTSDASPTFVGLNLSGTIVGVTTAITGTKNNQLIVSIPNQGTDDANGVGMILRADDGGSGGTGNHSGGSIVLDLGSKAGTSANGFLQFALNNSAFGYLFGGGASADITVLAGNVSDGATAVSNALGAYNNMTTAGAKLLSIRNNISSVGGTEKVYVDKDGTIGQVAVVQQFSGTKTLTDEAATGFADIAIATGEFLGGYFVYTINVTDGTDFQSHTGTASFNAVNKAGTVSSDIEESYAPAAESEVKTAGTLTDDFTITDGAGKITINCNANTSLAGATITMKYTIFLQSTNAITGL
jgi:hypothetical protein